MSTPEDIVWRSPESFLLSVGVALRLPVRLRFAVGQNGIELEGTLGKTAKGVACFCMEDAQALDTLLHGKPFRGPLPCRALMDIAPGQVPNDPFPCGEYSARGEVTVFHPTGQACSPCMELRVSHRLALRKTRHFERTGWQPCNDALVRLMVVEHMPQSRQELTQCLGEALRQPEQCHNLADISRGGAQLVVDRELAMHPLGVDERYLMLLTPHKQESHLLPLVFLAKKVGMGHAANAPGQYVLRLHFVEELDWVASSSGNLVWRDIAQSGSPELETMLEECLVPIDMEVEEDSSEFGAGGDDSDPDNAHGDGDGTTAGDEAGPSTDAAPNPDDAGDNGADEAPTDMPEGK